MHKTCSILVRGAVIPLKWSIWYFNCLVMKKWKGSIYCIFHSQILYFYSEMHGKESVILSKRKKWLLPRPKRYPSANLELALWNTQALSTVFKKCWAVCTAKKKKEMMTLTNEHIQTGDSCMWSPILIISVKVDLVIPPWRTISCKRTFHYVLWNKLPPILNVNLESLSVNEF